MKLLVIGLGQCGSNIADCFAHFNKRARARRGIEIITDTFAVNLRNIIAIRDARCSAGTAKPDKTPAGCVIPAQLYFCHTNFLPLITHRRYPSQVDIRV